jgi:hypothetical protein
MTNPTPANAPADSESALIAAVETALNRAHDMHYSNIDHTGNYIPDATFDAGRAAFRLLLTRQREREAENAAELTKIEMKYKMVKSIALNRGKSLEKLWLFAERVAKANPDDFFEEEHATMIRKIADDASNLLTALGGGESGVGE